MGWTHAPLKLQTAAAASKRRSLVWRKSGESWLRGWGRANNASDLRKAATVMPCLLRRPVPLDMVVSSASESGFLPLLLDAIVDNSGRPSPTRVIRRSRLRVPVTVRVEVNVDFRASFQSGLRWRWRWRRLLTVSIVRPYRLFRRLRRCRVAQRRRYGDRRWARTSALTDSFLPEEVRPLGVSRMLYPSAGAMEPRHGCEICGLILGLWVPGYVALAHNLTAALRLRNISTNPKPTSTSNKETKSNHKLTLFATSVVLDNVGGVCPVGVQIEGFASS